MQQEPVLKNTNDIAILLQQKIDTINKVVHDTIYIAQKNDLINAYEKTIDAQSSTYNTIITVFLGLVVIFAGATWWYNRKIAKSEIIKAVHKVFTQEKKDFLVEQKLEFNKELHIQKAESARLFALFNISMIEKAENDEDRFAGNANLIYWYQQVYINNFIASNPIGERHGIDNLIQALQKITDDEIQKGFFKAYQISYDFNYLYDSLKWINDSLSGERIKLYNLLENIAEVNGFDLTNNKSGLEVENDNDN